MGIFWAILLVFASNAFASKNILLTGYWPPTNSMLRRFSQNGKLNPEGWVGKNWNNSGYDVYAFFPTFAGPKDKIGSGDFPVDFAATFNDFFKITNRLHPVAIVSFGQGAGFWRLEDTFPPSYADMFTREEIPSEISAEIQHEIPESLKEKNTYHSTLPLAAILQKVPGSFVSHDPGTYLCGFLGYLGAWYHSLHENPRDPAYNAMSGFIHTDTNVEKASAATVITLQAVVDALKKP